MTFKNGVNKSNKRNQNDIEKKNFGSATCESEDSGPCGYTLGYHFKQLQTHRATSSPAPTQVLKIEKECSFFFQIIHVTRNKYVLNYEQTLVYQQIKM